MKGKLQILQVLLKDDVLDCRAEQVRVLLRSHHQSQVKSSHKGNCAKPGLCNLFGQFLCDFIGYRTQLP